MAHAIALAVEVLTTVMAVAGMVYFLAAIVAARLFLLRRDAAVGPDFYAGREPSETLKGLDPGSWTLSGTPAGIMQANLNYSSEMSSL